MPAEFCVYRCFDADGRLLYVGATSGFDARQKVHAKDSAWFPHVARWDRTIFKDRASMLFGEREAIRRENPIHNGKRYVEDLTDHTNAARQARHRKARALGYVSIPAGYLPQRRALKVFQWLDEAAEELQEARDRIDAEPAQS